MLRLKIMVCTGVLVLGLCAGWYLNVRLQPQVSQEFLETPTENTVQSKGWSYGHSGTSFGPREYIRIIRMDSGGETLEP
jgi:hypothetical protein